MSGEREYGDWRALLLIPLLTALAMLPSACVGMFDLTGANAKAAAQAQVDAEYERTKQAVILRGIEAERTEAARAYYAALLALEKQGGQAQDGQPVSGMNHAGGATVGAKVEVGAGIGWPFLLALGLLFTVVPALVILILRQRR